MAEEGQIKVRLIVTRGPNRGKEFVLEEGSNLVGRWDPDTQAFPEIDLEDDDLEAKVSRKHALITKNGAAVTVTDIGSLNGTYINRGSRLAPGVEHALQNGDELIIGKSFLKVEIES